jgi:hypothetical protein
MARNIPKTVLEDLVEEGAGRDFRKSKLAKWKLVRLLPRAFMAEMSAQYDQASADLSFVRGRAWDYPDGRVFQLRDNNGDWVRAIQTLPRNPQKKPKESKTLKYTHIQPCKQ